MGGLDNFPTLPKRTSDNPGPGKYELPGSFGPHSSSRHVSILGARSPRSVTDSHLGPGTYDPRPPSKGTSHTIAPALSNQTVQTSQSGTLGPKYDVTQHEMAAHPSSPRYSMGIRSIPSSPRRHDIPTPGPGSYTFEADGHSLSKFKKNSVRIGPAPKLADVNDTGRLLGPRTQGDYNPGPGTYESPRFGDNATKSAGPAPPRRREKNEVSPGPASYVVDQHTIGKNSTPRSKLVEAACFGGKGHPLVGASCAPGPGQYALPDQWKTKGKGITISHRPDSYGDLEAVNPKPGPGEYQLPPAAFPGGSKGFSISPRYEAIHTRHHVSPGPGSYTVQRGDLDEMAVRLKRNDMLLTRNGTTTSPKDSVTTPRKPTEASQGTPGPGSYVIPGAIDQRKGTSMGPHVNSLWRDSPWLNDLSRTPGPGTYNFDRRVNDKVQGTTFYKGQFMPIKEAMPTPGPGAYDDSKSYESTAVHKAIGFSTTTH